MRKLHFPLDAAYGSVSDGLMEDPSSENKYSLALYIHRLYSVSRVTCRVDMVLQIQDYRPPAFLLYIVGTKRFKSTPT